jgi:hypothetical protein
MGFLRAPGLAPASMRNMVHSDVLVCVWLSQAFGQGLAYRATPVHKEGRRDRMLSCLQSAPVDVGRNCPCALHWLPCQ